MNPETIALIRDLAAQLGTTADHLIALFVPRVIAGAIFWIFVGTAIYCGAYTGLRRVHAIPEDAHDRHFPITICWIASIALCLLFTFAIGDAISTLASPRAAAILAILRAVRGE